MKSHDQSKNDHTSGNESQFNSKLCSVFCDADMPRNLFDIMKIAGPSSISAFLGQVVYLINIIAIAQTQDAKLIAGIGLGQVLSQLFGIYIFIGLNSGLQTKLSQAYGMGMDGNSINVLMKPGLNEHLELCGYYMNKAYLQNILLFAPLGLLLGNMWFFMDIVNVNQEVSNLAQQFIWGTIPHVFLTGLFEIHKVQLISYRKSETQMIAQAACTLSHIPILLNIMRLLPNNPVLAIALATSTSSLFKLTVVSLVSRFHDDVRNSLMPFFTWKTLGGADSPSDIYSIGLPNLIMWISEGFSFQILVLFSGLISVDD